MLAKFYNSVSLLPMRHTSGHLFMVTMDQPGRQQGDQPPVDTCIAGVSVSNAPVLSPFDVQWHLPPPLSDQRTMEDLKCSLDFAHSNIEALKNEIKANAILQKQQADFILKLQDAYTEFLNYAVDLEEYISSH